MIFFKLAFPHWYLQCRYDIIIPTFHYQETRRQRGSKLCGLQLELGLKSESLEEKRREPGLTQRPLQPRKPSLARGYQAFPGPGRASGGTCAILSEERVVLPDDPGNRENSTF